LRQLALLATLGVWSAPATAQLFPLINQGWGTLGSADARTLGMGGSCTAVAAGVFATSCNPAGLSQTERPAAGLVLDAVRGGDRTSQQTDTAFTNGGSQHVTRDGSGDFDAHALAFLTVAAPLDVNGHLVVLQGGYRRIAQFPSLLTNGVIRCTATDATGAGTGCSPAGSPQLFRQDQRWGGGFDAYSLSVASHAVGKMTAGLSFNYLHARQEARWDEIRTDTGLSLERRLVYSFSGLYVGAGVQWAATDRVVAGAAYQAGFDGGLDYDEQLIDTSQPSSPAESSGDARLRWPDAFAAGVAWRVNDRTLVTADYSKTRWSQAIVRGYRAPEAAAGVDVSFPFSDNQQDSDAWRAGAEYVVHRAADWQVTARAGLYREQQPGQLVNAEVQAPLHSIGSAWLTGFSAGVGARFGSTQLDLAWSHSRLGRDANANGVSAGSGGPYALAVYAHEESTTNRFVLSVTARL
jgi:long-subunit fatty acid transport protein